MSGPSEFSGRTDASTSGEAAAGEIEHAGAPSDAGAFGTTQRGMFGVRDAGDTTGFGGLVRGPFVPPQAERPYGGYFDEVVDALQAAYKGFDDAVLKVVVDRGELTLYLRREHLLGIATALRDDSRLRFELCSSVGGVDYLGTDSTHAEQASPVDRLHAVYELRSMTYRRRIRLEVAVSVDDAHIPSVTAIYPTADWQEREAYDMFGIIFDGHPALTRILMPDDWEGFPQRKDYPLGGVAVEYKGGSIPPPDERRAYR
ncbi:MAG: NADH-quinone oxidoreductase subunit C [Jatrophihabitans sp.]